MSSCVSALATALSKVFFKTRLSLQLLCSIEVSLGEQKVRGLTQLQAALYAG